MDLRSVASQVVKVAAATSDLVRPRELGVTILGYHRVGQRSTLSVDLPLDLFARQMHEISGSRHVVSLDRALGLLRQADEQNNYVAVTFDDGTADFVDLALPVLERFQIPATLYVATDFIERGVSFPYGGKPLSWAALSDALSTNLVTVGSHTHTHALLDRLDPIEVQRELDRSAELISERLGRPAVHFAYPKAVAGSTHAVEAIAARFESAALAGTRKNTFHRTDPHRLARSPIQTSDGMRWFRRKVNGGMRLEDDLRRIANRRRYAGATT
jgi:peptidoglycan/xylan/chitin deacetylase (PgdA/CDA1 family)